MNPPEGFYPIENKPTPPEGFYPVGSKLKPPEGFYPVEDKPKPPEGFTLSEEKGTFWDKVKRLYKGVKELGAPTRNYWSPENENERGGFEQRMTSIDVNRLTKDPEYAKQVANFAVHQQENFVDSLKNIPPTLAEGVLRWATDFTGFKWFGKQADKYKLQGNVNRKAMAIGAGAQRYVTIALTAGAAAKSVAEPMAYFAKEGVGLGAKNAARFARIVSGWTGGATFWGMDEAGRQIAPFIDKEKELTYKNFVDASVEVNKALSIGGLIGATVSFPNKYFSVPGAGMARYAYETEKEKKTGISNKGIKIFKVFLNMFAAATMPDVPDYFAKKPLSAEEAKEAIKPLFKEYMRFRDIYNPAKPNPRVLELMGEQINKIAEIDPGLGLELWKNNLPSEVAEKIVSFFPDSYHAAPVEQKKAFIKEINEQLSLFDAPINQAIPKAAVKTGLDKIDVKSPESVKNIEKSIITLKQLQDVPFPELKPTNSVENLEYNKRVLAEAINKSLQAPEEPKAIEIPTDKTLSLAEPEKSYDEWQNEIDIKMDELETKGVTFQEASTDPEVEKLFAARDAVGQKMLDEAYTDITSKINNVTKDNKLTKHIANQIYALVPKTEAGQYMASEYTGRTVENREKTLKDIFTVVVKDYGEKNNLDMMKVLNPHTSGLGPKGISELKNTLLNKAKSIEQTVYEYFNRVDSAEEPIIKPAEKTTMKQLEPPAIKTEIPSDVSPEEMVGGSYVIKSNKRFVTYDKPPAFTDEEKALIERIRGDIARGEPAKRFWKEGIGGRTEYSVQRSTYPEYFRDKGFERKKAMTVLEKMLRGDVNYSTGGKGQHTYLKHFTEVIKEMKGGAYSETGERFTPQRQGEVDTISPEAQEKIPKANKEVRFMEGLEKETVEVGDLEIGKPVWVNKGWYTVKDDPESPFGKRLFEDGDSFVKDVDDKIKTPLGWANTIKGEKGFFEIPTKEEIKEGGKWAKNTFAPLLSVTPGQKDVLLKGIGQHKLATVKFAKNGGKIEKFLDKLGDEFNLRFANKFELGQFDQMDETEKLLADRYKTIYNFLYRVITQHKNVDKLDDFLAHIYESVHGGKIPEELKKNPLEGLKTFLHQRKIPTVQQAYDLWQAGEIKSKPVLNMETAVKVYYDRVMKYHYMNEMVDMFKEAGDMAYVNKVFKGKIPANFAKINDNITNVYLKAKIPKGGEVWAQVGEWYAHEDLARVINNHLSKDFIRSNIIGKTLSEVNHSINMVQLGLSGFHFTATNLHAAGNSYGMAMQDIARGNPGRATKHFILAPAAGPLRAGKGIYNMRKALSSEDPEVIKIVEQFYKGGGEIAGRDAESALKKVIANWKEGPRGKVQAAIKFIPALTQETVRPLFRHYIPGLKYSTSLETYARYKELHQEDLRLGKITEGTLMRNAVKEANYNFGKMPKDSFFWNKTLQHTTDFLIRSTMWNSTELIHLGGGELQTLNQIKNFAEGKPTQFTNNMADLWGIAFAHVMLGSAIYYGRFGKAPDNLKDAVFPPTKEKDSEGHTIRTSIPGYPKDMLSWHMHPIKSVKHKIAPLLNGFYNVITNENYFGDYVYNPDGDKKLQQTIKYLLTEWTVPFSIQDIYRRMKRGEDFFSLETPARYMGFREAAREWKVPALEKRIYKLYRQQFGGDFRSSPENREYRRKIVDARRRALKGDIEPTLGLMKKYPMKDIHKKIIGKKAFIPAAVRAFNTLSMTNQFKAIQGFSDEEIAPYKNLLKGLRIK